MERSYELQAMKGGANSAIYVDSTNRAGRKCEENPPNRAQPNHSTVRRLPRKSFPPSKEQC